MTPPSIRLMDLLLKAKNIVINVTAIRMIRSRKDATFTATGCRAEDTPDIVYISINAFWEPRRVVLPKLPLGFGWKLAVNTYEEQFYSPGITHYDSSIEIGPRSVVVLYADRIG